MPDVAVVTDTTSYLPRELVAEHGIHEVSLYVDDGERPASARPTSRLRPRSTTRLRRGQLPTTSQPSIGDFLAVYEPLADDGRDIVSIHISGGISGTVEAARQAAAELAARARRAAIEVIDSEPALRRRSASSSLAAARRRARAPTSSAVAARAREARRRDAASGSPSTRSSTCAAAGASAPRRRGSAAR